MMNNSFPPFHSTLRPRPVNTDRSISKVGFPAGRKMITVHLKENTNGRFVRIIESSQTRQSSIVIPAEGLQELIDTLAILSKLK